MWNEFIIPVESVANKIQTTNLLNQKLEGLRDKNQVLKQYGKGIEAILKNNLWYKLLKDEGYSMYFIEGKYVTFFFDLYNRDTVRSILWVEREYEKKKEGYYGDNRVEDRREGFENLIHTGSKSMSSPPHRLCLSPSEALNYTMV